MSEVRTCDYLAEKEMCRRCKLVTGTIPHTGKSAPNCEKRDIVSAYYHAKDVVLHAGFSDEIVWQASLSFDDVTESDFLREHAWVALSAGMHERVIRKRFQTISQCFYDWESAKTITTQADACRCLALRHFNNYRKIEGIIETAHIVASLGFHTYKKAIRLNPLQVLRSLPFIGPVTCYHLAKNIGLPFAKPDRHLVRLANSVGYSHVQQFCKDISACAGDSIPVVDIVLWRFATIDNAYLTIFHDIAVRGME